MLSNSDSASFDNMVDETMDYILINACKYWRDKCAEQIDPPTWRFDRLTERATSYWLQRYTGCTCCVTLIKFAQFRLTAILLL